MQFIIANNGMYINDTQDDIYRLLAISRFQYFYKVITKVFDNLHLHTCVTAPISVTLQSAQPPALRNEPIMFKPISSCYIMLKTV